jgi:site-specific DNA-methyltransferase (adenine-specific)
LIIFIGGLNKLKIMKEINIVHNGDWLNNQLPDKSVQLIIADPPYFQVKGDFDFVWKTFDDYLADVERWAIECKRVLADNGTLFWYGDAKNIAYAQVIFDKHFNLLNSLVWENTNDHKQQIRFNTDLRTFAPLTERLLMYDKKTEPNKNIFAPVMNYIKSERLKCGWNYSQMDEFLKIKASSCFWDKETSHEFVIPTKENWVKLQQTGNFQKEYEVLRKEYEVLRRPFNNERFYGDVIRIPNYETTKYEHDTIKPEKLTRELILISSRPNDLILVPFAGSGTECAMAVKENRNFIGFDIEEKYVKMANKRVNLIKQAPQLF